MAQQDTGLGWSAESDWLLSVGDAQIASYSVAGGPSYPNQPIPVFPNADQGSADVDIALHGLKILHNNYNNVDAYIGSMGDNTFIAYVANDSFGSQFKFISTQRDMYLAVVYVNPNGTINSSRRFSVNPGNYDATSGLYYYETSLQTPNTNWMPQFNTLRDALDAITIANATFTKVNPGYAVGCVAKWKTQNGTELISPILISSDTDIVDMTTTATGHNFAKLNYLLSGVRFYMGFWDIPGDIVITTPLQEVDFTDRGNMTLDQLFMTIISTSYAHVIIINSPDPYSEEGAGSGEEGGDGEDLEDDGMGITHHAIPAAINTGFCRIYCPNEQQLRDLSNFLWSAQFDITAVKKLFANPMDSVLGLSAVPINLSGASMRLYLGGVDTEMSFPMVSYQSYQVPMGYITVKERWGSYLDYDPYTKFSIYLPFIGFKDLSADDIMGKQLILDYDIDILSGACTARLQAGTNTLYQWSGQCAIQLPVTASNWNQVFQSATSAALSAGLAVATGTAGPVLAGALAAEGAQAIMGKPRIERGGTASGAAGWMGGLQPYLVRVTPEAIIPNNQNKYIGYPAFSSISLGALTGYNEISSIHLEGIPATGAELEELEAILKGGVIF